VLVAGDATTITKSGKHTNGLGRFFSSIYARAIPGLSFQQLVLIGTQARRAWPILQEQIMPSTKAVADDSASRQTQTTTKHRGRPKGSKNKNRSVVDFNEEQEQLKRMLKSLLELCKGWKSLMYFVYDGALGNNMGIQLTRQLGMHLISKLRHNSELYFPWQGIYSGRGRPKKYGERVKVRELPNTYLKHTETIDGVQTRTYQFTSYSKKVPDALNVVAIVKTDLSTQKTAHVLLFSTDLNLSYDQLIDYYSLRFQIEFCFRDAKQHWGLEDFMVTEKKAVQNSANIAMWIVNLSQRLLESNREASVLDLKSRFRGEKYAREVIKMLPDFTHAINIPLILDKIASIGRIHEHKAAA
jgi:putative transposase